jgi:hypothetical protein
METITTRRLPVYWPGKKRSSVVVSGSTAPAALVVSMFLVVGWLMLWTLAGMAWFFYAYWVVIKYTFVWGFQALGAVLWAGGRLVR